MNWKSTTTWITDIDIFTTGCITKDRNGYQWNITQRDIFSGRGDCISQTSVAHGKVDSLKEAKDKIKQFEKGMQK